MLPDRKLRLRDLKISDFTYRNLAAGGYNWLWVSVCLLLVALLIGSMPLFGLSPLLIGGIVFAVFGTWLCFRSPLLALYGTIFVNLLPQGFIPDTIQSVGALALLLVSLLAWLLQASFQRRKVIWTTPVLFGTAFFLWAFTTLLWAKDLVVSRQMLVQYAIVITVMFLLINQVDSVRALDSFMTILAVSGWVLIGIGLWTVLFGGYTLGDRLKLADMNENLLGPLLMLTTTGVVWQTMRSPGTKTRSMFLSLCYIVVALILIALSGSRGSLVGFALILIVFGFAKATRPWALWGAALAGVGLFIAPFIFVTVLDRFTSDTEDAYGDRDVLWTAGLWLLSDHPLTGIGIGNGPYVMLNYVNAVSDTDHIAKYTTRPAHNPILEVGDDTGLIGLLLYLASVLSALWLFLRQFIRGVRQRIDALTAYCSLVACISIGFLATWLKSGGLADHISLFILLTLWLIPYRVQMFAFMREAPLVSE
jgi:putative inorganic carbon (hco3(-)) transporter